MSYLASDMCVCVACARLCRELWVPSRYAVSGRLCAGLSMHACTAECCRAGVSVSLPLGSLDETQCAGVYLASVYGCVVVVVLGSSFGPQLLLSDQ